MKYIFGILAVILVFAPTSRADKDIWYLSFNYKMVLGATYSDGVNNDLSAIGATNHSKYGIEYAFHWKMVVPQLYLGGAVPIYWDKFERSNSSAPDNIVVAVPSASLIYSPLEDLANGPFGRFDLGYGVVNRPGRDLFNMSYVKTADSGLAYLVGFGWGLPFSESFAMYPILTYTSVMGKESYSITSLGVGIIL